MRPTILFLCIASLILTPTLALPSWKQVAKTPATLSSSLRVGTSTALALGEQALLRGGALLPRRSQRHRKRSASLCRDFYEYYEECSWLTPEEQDYFDDSLTDLELSSSQTGYNAR